MKRFSFGALAAASLALGAAACSQHAFEPVSVTTSAAAVASCEKVGDIAATKSNFDNADAETQMVRETRDKGANTLLVASDGASSGTAYRCSMPAVAASSQTGAPGSK
jgi:hypothetical protein